MDRHSVWTTSPWGLCIWEDHDMSSGCGLFNKSGLSVCPEQSVYLDRLSFDLGMIPAPCQRPNKGHLSSTQSHQGSPRVCFADTLATWPANGVILNLWKGRICLCSSSLLATMPTLDISTGEVPSRVPGKTATFARHQPTFCLCLCQTMQRLPSTLPIKQMDQ